MVTRIKLLIAVSFAAIVIAGCGDDDAPIEPIGISTTTDTDEAPESSGLSRRAFINAADARCAEANVAITGIESGSADVGAASTQLKGIVDGVRQSIQALDAPSDPSGALSRFFAGLEDQASVLRNRANAAAQGDTLRVDQLATELDGARTETRLAAEEFGFTECGQTGSLSTTPVDPGTATPVDPAPTPAPTPTPDPTGGTTDPGSGGGSDSGGSDGGSDGDSGSSGGVGIG